MGKPTICIGENEGTDQLRSNCEADQRLCFRHTDSTIPLQSFKLLALFCDCTARFVSDLVGTCCFSQAQAYISVSIFPRIYLVLEVVVFFLVGLFDIFSLFLLVRQV